MKRNNTTIKQWNSGTMERGFIHPLFRKSGGFTLIELMVVVSIIGLLSSIMLVALDTALSKAKDARIKGDIYEARSMAVIILGDERSYSSLCTDDGTFNTQHPVYSKELGILKDDIEKQGGTDLRCWANRAYCVQVKLRLGGYLCVDSQGLAVVTSTDTGCTKDHEYCGM